MQKPTLRPTFELFVAAEPGDVLERVRAGLAVGGRQLPVQSAGRHFTITPPAEEIHFWSPWLNLDLYEHDDGARLFGRFSPRPGVWTAFMFSYFGLGTAGLFAAMWAASQIVLDGPPTALWITLGCAVVAATLFMASQIGQRLAHDQMALLRKAVDDALEHLGAD